jgi:type I restriction enzyme, S subunit
MSGMNFLEKLLDGGAVEWKPLGKVGQVRMCKRILKSQTSSEGDIPFYKIGTFGKKPDAYISKSLFEEYKSKYSYPKIGEILISASGTIGRTVMFDGEDSYFQDSNIIWIENDESVVLNKFLFYFYQIANWGISVGGTIQRLYNDNLRKLSIPIPCPDNPDRSLAIQAEIVRILDTFTALTAELTAELTDRKKQYNYYRDRLLTFEKGEVEWKTLREVAEYSKKRISFNQLDKTNYMGVDNLLQNRAGKAESNYVPTEGNLTEYRDGDILIGNIRPYLKKIWLADRIGGTNGDVLVIHPTDESLNSRYLYQILADEKFFEYNMQHIKGAKMPRGNKDKIMEYRFPLPINPDEQGRIVAILDKFDTLTHSISEGLPREIALRQKQYEYYRDLLLTFPKIKEEQ